MSHSHDHHHDHDHDHDHDHAPDDPAPPREYELLEQAIRELLIEKGLLTAEQIQRQIDDMDSRTPMNGAKLVARAWTDPAFKRRLLTEPKTVIEEWGIDLDKSPELMVVENTDRVHNVIVCTLCSCYPRAVIGVPPAWYKKKAYRSRAVSEPRAVLAEFGTVLPDDVEIRVHDSTADLRYMVLPARPPGTEGWSEERLAELVSRDALIGVTTARPASD
ncbi:MAG: nitrile hydratase subunit alpha [Alphaproteobacteria bacterium]